MHAHSSLFNSIIGPKLSNLRAAGLCYGYGGLDQGLRRVLPGTQTVLLSEFEIAACSLLLARMDAGLLDPAPVWTDLRTLPWPRLVGKVDCITGGFPCQGFSTAGKQLADQDPRHLFPYFARAIGIIHPRLVVLENVPGIISATLTGSDWNDPAGTPVALHVLRELERCDYVASLQFSSASDVGLPHERRRVFFVAVRSDLVPDATCVGRGGIDRTGHVEGDRFGKTGPAIGEGHAIRTKIGGGCTLPARVSSPGQVQQPWEFPRVVDLNAKTSVITTVGRPTHGVGPWMGCSTEAFRDRVNWQTAIRLCGNGVVPAVAELAIRRALIEIFSGG